MKKLYGIQLALLLIVGIGALFGGIMAISDPSGVSYRASTDMLKTGPFTSFLIPGLFLVFVLGLGHLIAFIFVKYEFKLHPYISGGVGCILMAWILIQCYILHAIHSLHITFFFVGLLESSIALYMLIKLNLFPFTNQEIRRWH